MLLIPAIDIKNGRCVRLRQGRMEDETIFSTDPCAVAARWRNAGARRLHLVDLDGAVAGQPVNSNIIKKIVQTCPTLPIQIGGGIRNQETIDTYLSAGVRYVILGTKAVKNPEFVAQACHDFPDHILVGIDARAGKVAIEGWSQLSSEDAIDFAYRFEEMGVSGIIYTDISRDGMMTGVNVAATATLAQVLRTPVIASGGIMNLDDIRALCALPGRGIFGAITGRALYEGTLDFVSGQALADQLKN